MIQAQSHSQSKANRLGFHIPIATLGAHFCKKRGVALFRYIPVLTPTRFG